MFWDKTSTKTFIPYLLWAFGGVKGLVPHVIMSMEFKQDIYRYLKYHEAVKSSGAKWTIRGKEVLWPRKF